MLADLWIYRHQFQTNARCDELTAEIMIPLEAKGKELNKSWLMTTIRARLLMWQRQRQRQQQQHKQQLKDELEQSIPMWTAEDTADMKTWFSIHQLLTAIRRTGLLQEATQVYIIVVRLCAFAHLAVKCGRIWVKCLMFFQKDKK
jgi:hypothetical protein